MLRSVVVGTPTTWLVCVSSRADNYGAATSQGLQRQVSVHLDTSQHRDAVQLVCLRPGSTTKPGTSSPAMSLRLRRRPALIEAALLKPARTGCRRDDEGQ